MTETKFTRLLKPKHMATPTKKPAPKQTAPSGPRSLADLFDEADGSGVGNMLPEGEHKVRINEMTFKEDPKKGSAVVAEYEAIDGEHEGKKIRQLYKLTDSERQVAPGMNFLKRDFGLLKYEDVTGAKMKKTLAKITEEQPLVIIQVKENGNYINARLQGLAEGEEEAPEPDADAPELEVGSEVTFTDDGEDGKGTVTKIKGDSIIITDEDGARHVVERENVKLASEEEPQDPAKEEAAIEVGSIVQWDNGDETGTVVKIKGTDAIVLNASNKKKETIALDDLSLKGEETATDEPPEVGDEVKWDDDGTERTGTITKINEAKGQATVKDDDDDLHLVPLNDLEKVD